jgi:uncharacterized membrane protein YagU involved in acid resistance
VGFILMHYRKNTYVKTSTKENPPQCNICRGLLWLRDHLLYSWMGPISPSSFDLIVRFFFQFLHNFASALLLPKLHFSFNLSFPLPFITLEKNILIELPWKENHQDESFHLPWLWILEIFLFKLFITKFKNERLIGSIRITPPHLEAFGPQMLQLNYLYSSSFVIA